MQKERFQISCKIMFILLETSGKLRIKIKSSLRLKEKRKLLK